MRLLSRDKKIIAVNLFSKVGSGSWVQSPCCVIITGYLAPTAGETEKKPVTHDTTPLSAEATPPSNICAKKHSKENNPNAKVFEKRKDKKI